MPRALLATVEWDAFLWLIQLLAVRSVIGETGGVTPAVCSASIQMYSHLSDKCQFGEFF